ncbi:DUF4209 domain-containing protein [Commensalibacter sp. M0402]|uniref:DUF4209 domain-containing protein n=1 Tax=Commensalibacter TaxID=1079922 RepID=UPI0018DDFDAF|nr:MULTISPECIES: DUF4209 domain-containing protein [Commensalibacter]MBI0083778.1 DUF4209 domain-containing protein [Commensalibacter sp. W6292M3]MBI0089014.1 DUF4209 domain-containing protein [Commensalibacter melissae]
MKNSPKLTREAFLECNWKYEPEQNPVSYDKLHSSLKKIAKEKLDIGQQEQYEIFELLAEISLMYLDANNKDKPFRAFYTNIILRQRTKEPSDLTKEELEFLSLILNDIPEPSLKARIADILWLVQEPKNYKYAQIAIDSYTYYTFDNKKNIIFLFQDLNKYYERAIYLCQQINDSNQLDKILSKLTDVFKSENDRGLILILAKLIDKTKNKDVLQKIVMPKLYQEAIQLKNKNNFHLATIILTFLNSKYKQFHDRENEIKSLFNIAEYHEYHGDFRYKNNDCNAYYFYDAALQTYNKIPKKNRNDYDVDNKIHNLHAKLEESNQIVLANMDKIHIGPFDITNLVQAFVQRISNKTDPIETLKYFTDLPIAYQDFVHDTAILSNDFFYSNILSKFYRKDYRGDDGRLIAKISPDDEENKLNEKNQEKYRLNIYINIPLINAGLNQLHKEDKFSKEIFENICHKSLIVPKNREKIMANALWSGFQKDFIAAIYLLCPQVENIIRDQLKKIKVRTSNLDKNNIETYNSLNTLLKLPEIEKILDVNLLFEFKSLFIDPIGFNLRNNTAHGLLEDNKASLSASIYAWWFILKWVFLSIK